MFEVIIGISILAVIIGVCAWFFDQIISPVFSWLGSNPVMAVILVVVAIAAIVMWINAYSKAESKYQNFKD